MSKTIVVEGSDNLIDAQAALIAKSLGLDYDIVVADDKSIQLDLDNLTYGAPMPKLFLELLTMFARAEISYRGYYVTRSKSGNTHVTIRFNKSIPITERIAWQAIFGSDPMREALHMMAMKRNVKNPILMFEPKNRSEELVGVPDLAAEPVGRFFREEIAEETLPAGSA